MTDDILSQALGLMRITGSLLLVGAYAPPWGITIPHQHGLAELLQSDSHTQVVAFHMVHRGSFELRGPDGDVTHINAGDVLVCFGGRAHTISQGQPSAPVTLAAHLQGRHQRFEPITSGDQQDTALICGVFFLRDTYLNPLFAALPVFLHASAAQCAQSALLSSVTDVLAREITWRGYGSDYVAQRLLELLCVEIIRAHMSATDDETAWGWLRGINDPLLARALHRFHQAPGEPWSVDRLSAEVHLSSSRFAARFTAAFGESCMIYVTKWRLSIARRLLRATDDSIEDIAQQVGYQNLPAFTRVFRRYFGSSPTA